MTNAAITGILDEVPQLIGTDNAVALDYINSGVDLARSWADKHQFDNGLWKVLAQTAAKDRAFVGEIIDQAAGGEQAVSADFIKINGGPSRMRDFKARAEGQGYRVGDGYTPHLTLFVPNKTTGGVDVVPRGMPVHESLTALASDLFTGKITQRDAAALVETITGKRTVVLGHGHGTAP